MLRLRRPRATLIVGIIIATSAAAWSAERIIAVPSRNRPQVYRLEDLPPLGGAAASQSPDRATAKIREYGRVHEDTYAGSFVSGPYIFVGFTSEASTNFAALQARLGSSVPVKVFQAQFTLATLARTVDRISQDIASWRKRGIEISAVWVDEYRNRVQVALANVSDDTMVVLKSTYGDMLAFSEGTFRAV